MQILVAAVGQRMPSWVQEAWTEYARRFPRGFSLALREVPMVRRGRNTDIAAAMDKEGAALLGAMPKGGRLIAMDERGSQWSTGELAKQMESWMNEGRDVGIMVGGPDGLPQKCLQNVANMWSLSKLTLPHPMVRVVLAEALYRAWTVTQNHPYHRA
jgi:23S rRNA (pseudouridine1915-N3)-methyltransferase